MRPARWAMYRLKPPHVFVHRRVYRDGRAVARLQRMLAALGSPPVEEVGEGDTERVLALAGPPAQFTRYGPVRMGFDRSAESPSILFNTFVWNESQRSAVDLARYGDPVSQRTALLMAGAGEDFAFSRREGIVCDGVRYVCQGGWGLHTFNGCAHRCDYCYEGYVVNIMLDLEEFAEHTHRMMLARPRQKLYRYDMYGDSICFEPEYGASAVLSETFARAGGGRRLLFYTKSDNVDHLLDLPCKSSCIFYLSLAPPTVCREIEPGTPSMEARIKALRKCERAGYPVRVGFSPIIPTPNWRREATECIEALFAAVRPQTVRLWVLSLMRPDAAAAMFEPDRLDERYLQAIRNRRDFRPGEIFDQPFPHWARGEIYGHYLDEIHRISPRTPVSLCSERRDLWEMLAPKLTMSPDALHCCCGGVSP